MKIIDNTKTPEEHRNERFLQTCERIKNHQFVRNANIAQTRLNEDSSLVKDVSFEFVYVHMENADFTKEQNIAIDELYIKTAGQQILECLKGK